MADQGFRVLRTGGVQANLRMMPVRATLAAEMPITVMEWEVLTPEVAGGKARFDELIAWALTDTGRLVLEAGRDRIRVLNHAGVVMLKSGLILEVLPKTHAGQDVEDSRQLLLRMLIRSGVFPAVDGSHSPAALARLPLSKAMARIFLDSVLHLVKRGLLTNYESREGELPCVRGRILVGEIVRKGYLRHRIPCGYEVLSMNSKENRILATAIHLVRMTIGRGSMISDEQYLEDAFGEVERYGSSHEALKVLQGIVVDRKNIAYRETLAIARLILSGLDAAGSWAREQYFSLFFPMEKVFEGYVLQELLDMKHRGEFRSVLSQSSPHYLLYTEGGSNRPRSFNLRPDFVVITDSGERWILDAKWKRLNEGAADGKNGISQADLYQLLSYSSVYRREREEVDCLFLIYPKWRDFSSPVRYQYADETHTPLRVVPFPIEEGAEWKLETECR